jgi:transposase-like protein
MKGSENSPKDKEMYGHIGQEREMKSEIEEQSGDSMEKPTVVPNSEVKAAEKKKNRRFTAEYKMRILREVDLCRGTHGAVGAFLRREGLYSSALVEWKRQRESGVLNALSQKRGRKLKHTPEVVEVKKLERRCERLEEENRQLRVVIEAQKKISEILGVKQVDTSHLEDLGQ